ncbi:hypothetical protein OS493_030566 [Desmophyllum pertusum]|uniref:Uncharacterized protein n=1 Tax=Desmophyllum pertusum TaxID=174260 RepID=A0A9X0CD77_9CNID|nr:hypothetical protein OS493_030566 [Desmophyllum pertusum]
MSARRDKSKRRQVQDETDINFKFDGPNSRNSTPPVKLDKKDRDKEKLQQLEKKLAMAGQISIISQERHPRNLSRQ